MVKCKCVFVILIFFFVGSLCYAQDEDVAQLQRFLSGLGYYHGSIDGIYGPGTTAGVVNLQQFLSGVGYYRGPIDGVFGSGTALAIETYIRDQSTRSSGNTYSQQKQDTNRNLKRRESQKGSDTMNNRLLLAWIIFVLLELFVLNAFFEQRAALEIGRKIGQDIRILVLPKWYPWTNLARILSWCALLYIAVFSIWYYPLIVLGTSFIITTVFPVPQSKYLKVMEKLSNLDM